MGFVKQLAGQTFIYGLGTIVPRVLNYLLLTPFYTRWFEQAEYGIITELYAYVAFLLVLLTYGMETGFFRFNESENNKQKVYSTALITLFSSSLIFITLVSVFSNEIASLIRYEHNNEYVIWFAIIVGCDAFSSIPFAKLRAENRAKKFSIIKILNVTVNIGFNVFFFVICRNHYHDSAFIQKIYNPDIGIGYAFISNMISSIFTLFILIPDYIKIKFYYDTELIRRMLNYSLPLLVVGLAGMVNEVADKIFLKYLTAAEFEPMKMVGIYGANYKLGILMTIFIQMFRYAAEPFFFAKAKEKDSKEMYATVMRLFTIFGLLIFLVVMLYIDIIKYFIDEKFHEGLVVVPIILIANLFLGIYYNLSVWYKLTNKTRYGAIISITGAIITVVLNILLIPRIGYLGSAWATFFCYLGMMLFSYILGKKHFPIKYHFIKMFYYAAGTALVYYLSILNKDYLNWNIYLVNTILLSLFVLLIIWKERALFVKA